LTSKFWCSIGLGYKTVETYIWGSNPHTFIFKFNHASSDHALKNPRYGALGVELHAHLAQIHRPTPNTLW